MSDRNLGGLAHNRSPFTRSNRRRFLTPVSRVELQPVVVLIRTRGALNWLPGAPHLLACTLQPKVGEIG